jgi:hypothetical protein
LRSPRASRPHGLSVVELGDHLRRSAQRGWIEFRDSSGTLFDVSRIDLRAELERPDRRGITYGLTADGGRLWETEAEADWSRFIYDSDAEEDDAGRNREVICAAKQRTRECLEFFRTSAAPGAPVQIDAEIWDVCEPFNATYWKTLPRGYRVRYRERRPPPKPGSSCAVTRLEWAAWLPKHKVFSHWKRDLFQGS